MMVRIAINITTSIQPFYLEYVTKFTPTTKNPTPVALALCPLVSYITSLIFSFFLYKRMMQKLRNRFYPLFLSIIIIVIGSVPFIFLDESTNYLVYIFSSI